MLRFWAIYLSSTLLTYVVKFLGVAGSYALGVALSSVILFVLFMARVKAFDFAFLFGVFGGAAGVFIHAIVGTSISDVGLQWSRLITNLLVMLVVVFFLRVSYVYRFWVVVEMGRGLLVLLFLFPVFAVSAYVGMISVVGFSYTLPIFPFQEPSHFYNLYTLSLMTALVLRRYRVVGLAGYCMSLFFYPSATGLFGLALASLIMGASLSSWWRPFGVAVIVLVGGAFFYFNQSNLYYTERLLFWESGNLSALVFVQGLESMWLGLKETYGVGVGLGQMSGIAVQTEAASQIESITGKVYNIKSGGFVASQLVTEFGLFGVVVSCLLLYFAFRFRWVLSSNCYCHLLAYGFLLASLVELFVRGYGFFSPVMMAGYLGVSVLLGGADEKK